MIIYGKEKLDAFISKQDMAKDAVDKWLQIIEDYNFKDHNGLKVIFPTVEYIGNERYMFLLKGDDYKVVIVTVFVENTIVIRWIGTFVSYNKLKDCSTF